MRMSLLFGQTLREPPSDAEVESHRLLTRAGYVRQLGTGIFSVLPLGRRAMDRVERILRLEMDAIGGQEVTLPVVHPADLWRTSGRYQSVGPEMSRFQDREGRDLVLAMTHEEVVADLGRGAVRSWRDLPRLVYQIHTKWRDDPRPRAGLIRVREFTMKDSYSLDADWQGLERQYRAHQNAYARIFARCGLPVLSVRSDVGMMGGRIAHEYMYLTPVGEDTLLVCRTPGCGYMANRQVARFRRRATDTGEPRTARKVATPRKTTIADLAQHLGVGAEQTAKAVFMMSQDRLVFAVVRGDLDVNETKLTAAAGLGDLRPARDEEIRAAGAVPGYASPIGLAREGRAAPLVIADVSVRDTANLVAGANEEGFHLLDTCMGRDYQPDVVADIAAADEGALCPDCGKPMRASRGVEVGNIFQLGTRFSEAAGLKYLDHDGKTQPVVMGSYGIGVGRLLACIAEEHHDERGLALPVTVAPFAVHLVALPGTQAREHSERIYQVLCAEGMDVLYDDRDERAGVKFMDADLVGCPLRVTVGDKGAAKGGVEMKHRRQAETVLVPFGELGARLRTELDALTKALTP